MWRDSWLLISLFQTGIIPTVPCLLEISLKHFGLHNCSATLKFYLKQALPQEHWYKNGGGELRYCHPLHLPHLLGVLWDRTTMHFQPSALSHRTIKTGGWEVLILLSWRPGWIDASVTGDISIRVRDGFEHQKAESGFPTSTGSRKLSNPNVPLWTVKCSSLCRALTALSPRYMPQDYLKPGISLSGANLSFHVNQ